MVEAKKDISEYRMHYYNLQRPHQHNGGVAPIHGENRLNLLSGIS